MVTDPIYLRFAYSGMCLTASGTVNRFGITRKRPEAVAARLTLDFSFSLTFKRGGAYRCTPREGARAYLVHILQFSLTG